MRRLIISYVLTREPAVVDSELLELARSRSADCYTGIHAAYVMGRLNRDAYIPCLLDMLSWNYELLEEALADIFPLFESRVELPFVEALKELGPAHAAMALSTLGIVGGETTIAFVLEHADEFLIDTRELVLDLMQSLPDERFIENCGIRLRKNQPRIDEAFLVMSLRLVKTSPELTDLEQACLKKGKSSGLLPLIVKPATCLRPCYLHALELDPASIEAYYGLAGIADDERRYNEALDWLEKGLPHLQRLRYRKENSLSKKEFLREYMRFYEGLQEELFNPHPQFDAQPVVKPAVAAPKIGRNDSCPCGSGKKYKKCCLNKAG